MTTRWTGKTWVSGGSYGHPDHRNMRAEHELGVAIIDIHIIGTWG